MRDAGVNGRGAARGVASALNPAVVVREVVGATFRGSRADLELVTALRLQAVIVLVFLAARCVHLGQAAVDLALAGEVYTREALAVAVAASCAVESAMFAALVLDARRLTRNALLGDAIFGVAALLAMSLAMASTPGRAGSLNWMLPYTVATATGLGAVTLGDVAGERPSLRGKLWPPAVALLLTAAYVASVNLPHRLAGDHPEQIWGNAADYGIFFAAGVLTVAVARRRVAAMSARNAAATEAAAQLAREAQWRAIAVDVFTPVVALLDRVARLPDGPVPTPLQREADRLIALIDAVRPGAEG